LKKLIFGIQLFSFTNYLLFKMFQLRHCAQFVRRLLSPAQRRQVSGLRHIDTPRQIVSIIGAPMVCGQTYIGTERAPDFLREYGLGPKINQCGFMVEDLGDLKLPKRSAFGPRHHYKDVIGEGNQMITKKWCEVAEDHSKFVLLLGGDQSISIGSVTASMKMNPDTVIVWVDAHANLRTPLTSETGNYHEMPVAVLMRLPGTECEFFSWLNDYPVLKPENLIYIGLRYLHPTEKAIVKSKGINTFTMFDVDERGIGQVMKEVLELINGRPIHLSFDVDACESFYVGGNNTPIRGGLTFRESHYICESLAQTDNLASMDICEVNPLLDSVDIESTYYAAISMVESCLGKKI